MNLEELKKCLKDNNATLAAYTQYGLYISHDRGIAPILNKLEEDESYFKDAVIVDKVIGKAACMLFILSGVKYIYGEVMSKKAVEILDEYQVEYSFHQLTDYIVNRTHTDMCPMEKTVWDIYDLNEAKIALINKVNELRG